MNTDIHDAAFWDARSDYRCAAHDFTAHYAEQAWRQAALPVGATVLDIAAGAGALALVAARAGAQVLATDFSTAMVASVLEHDLPNLDALVMDGQALALPDASFDAAFSMFGIMLFPDWRKGLAEMARVVRPDGLGCIGTWKHPAGAAANLLLAERVTALFPGVTVPTPLAGMNELREPDRLRDAMIAAGFADVTLCEVSSDYVVDEAALADPARQFQFSPLWPLLDAGQQAAVLRSIRVTLEAGGGLLPVPSPALIATARRR